MNRELKKWISNCIPPIKHSGAYLYYWGVFSIKYRPTRVEIYLYSEGTVYLTVRDLKEYLGHCGESHNFTLKITDWTKKKATDQVMGIFAMMEVMDA